MRIAVLLALAAPLTLGVSAAHAGSVAMPYQPVQVASHEDDDHDDEHGDVSREELRERKRRLKQEKREIRERERELREHEHERVVRRVLAPRFWVGVGAGGGFASVDIPCAPGSMDSSCDESGQVGTYSANVTLSGPHTALRLRGVRAQDKGNDARTPYEMAAMVGSRFGHSNWYGFLGAGRIQHADDEFDGDTHGFAWEFVFAPASHTATGFELSFQGDTGEDVDFVAINLGARFGLMR